MNAVRTTSVQTPTTSQTTTTGDMTSRAYPGGTMQKSAVQQVAEVVLVLELVVEVDQVVGGERGGVAHGARGGELLAHLLEPGLDRGRCLALVADVHARGHEERHDLAVGPLLDRAHTLRAHELVEPLAPASLDREHDGLGAH